MPTGLQIIDAWPERAREAAKLMLDAHGEPDDATSALLVWRDVSGCKRVIASKAFYQHDFPTPHTDSVESVIALASFSEPMAIFSSVSPSPNAAWRFHKI